MKRDIYIYMKKHLQNRPLKDTHKQDAPSQSCKKETYIYEKRPMYISKKTYKRDP